MAGFGAQVDNSNMENEQITNYMGPDMEPGSEVLHLVDLPHDEESERAVLAALLRDNNKYDDMETRLEVEDFYAERHQLIYAQIMRLKGKEGRVADAVTVHSALSDAGKLARAGGQEYLVDLDAFGENTANFHEYVQLVRDKAALRKLREETGVIQQKLHQPGEQSCGTIIEDAERRIFEVGDKYYNRRSNDTVRIDTMVEPITKQVTDLYDRVKKGGSPITGLATSFPLFDSLTSGLQSGDLVILAARPSLGKTSFALDMLRNVCSRALEKPTKAKKEKGAVLLFSLEMSIEQITKRLVGIEGRIDQFKLRSGRMHGSEAWERFSEAMERIEQWPLWVDDSSVLTVQEMRGRARRIQRRAQQNNEKLSLVIVDYLQLINSDNPLRNENRTSEVTQISRGLKALARELQVPVLALSQLSRNIENRNVKKPQLSDLRESGAIEQDADLIMFLSRKQSGMDEPDARSEDIELTIGKHRNGPTDTIDLLFEKHFTHFKEKGGQKPYDPDDQYRRNTESGEVEDYSFSS